MEGCRCPTLNYRFPTRVNPAAVAFGVVLAMRFWYVKQQPGFAQTRYGKGEGMDGYYMAENASEKLDTELGEQPTNDGVSVRYRP
jgi:hypothetical protein